VRRELLAAVKRLRAIYCKRTGLPAAVLRAHLENLQALERELLGVPANAAPEPDCVRRARQFIAAHLTDLITVGMVAKHVGLCPQQFRKRFKQATGLTCRQYLALHRVEHAKELLMNPERKVTDVAFEAGFQSLSPFYRAFRKHAGQSAAEYRRGFA